VVTLLEYQAYNPFGPPSEIGTGYGQIIDNTSGECGCLEDTNPGDPLAIGYSYDKNGNLTDLLHINDPSRDLHFEYDSLGMLSFASGWFGQIDYEYDKAGNRDTVTMNGAVQGYNYQTGTNKLDEVTGFDVDSSITYDAAGNITQRFGNTLIYNDNNRLEEVQSGGVTIAGYIYNGLGQRVVKATDTDTIILYNFVGNIIAEVQADGAITKEYLYNGSSRVAMVDLDFDAVYYFSNDRLGTPQMLLDGSGGVVWKARYMAFGEVDIHSETSIVNNFRFAGQYYDAETGLHYNYHRYYDPKIGRYITADPIGIDGGINLYAYVQNNPVNQIDPYGLKGGVLIPIRNAIKKNATANDILGPIIDGIIEIPVTPLAAAWQILKPRDVGVGSDYVPTPRDPLIPIDWNPYNPKYWNIPEDDVMISPCK
jgi:RHS repeat-associated protein